MFPKHAFEQDWLKRQAKTMGGCAPQILERCVHALTLLGHIAHLRTGSVIDFESVRYAGTKEQIDALRAGSFNNTPWDWADGLRQVNPEAYHYWLAASRLQGIGAKELKL